MAGDIHARDMSARALVHLGNSFNPHLWGLRRMRVRTSPRSAASVMATRSALACRLAIDCGGLGAGRSVDPDAVYLLGSQAEHAGACHSRGRH